MKGEKKMYYWEITFDNGEKEYWKTNKSTCNFTKNFKNIAEAKHLTQVVYEILSLGKTKKELT